MPGFSRLKFRNADLLPSASTFNRWVLDALIVFNVVAQGILVVLSLLGEDALNAMPVAAGATVALFLLVFFYTRWLLPVLNRRQVLAFILLKEAAVVFVLGLVIGLVALVRWLF